MGVEGIEEDGMHEVMQGLEVGDPFAVGRPGSAARELEAFVIFGIDQDGMRVVDVEIPEMQLLVGVKDALRIGRPAR